MQLFNSDLTYRTEYSADAELRKRDYNITAKGLKMKIGTNFELIVFIEEMIIENKYSPSSVLAEAKKNGYEVNFCIKTLYNYIDEGHFQRLTNDNLPVKRIGKERAYHHVRAVYSQKGKRIVEHENKEIFRDWELDTVVGNQGTKAALMIMTERSKGIYIIRKIESKS